MTNRKARASILIVGCAGESHHQRHGGDDGGDHYAQLIHHPDGRNDGVERKNDVDDDDLQNDGDESPVHDGRRLASLSLEQLVDLLRAFPQEEQPAGNEDQVAAGDLQAEQCKERCGEPDNPRERDQQSDAHEHREKQAEAARQFPVLPRQLVDEDRNEDDVVDAEHQFQRGERGERDPGLRVEEQFHQRRFYQSLRKPIVAKRRSGEDCCRPTVVSTCTRLGMIQIRRPVCSVGFSPVTP